MFDYIILQATKITITSYVDFFIVFKKTRKIINDTKLKKTKTWTIFLQFKRKNTKVKANNKLNANEENSI